MQDDAGPPMRPPDPPSGGGARTAGFWRAQAVIWSLVALASLASRVTVFRDLPVALVASVLVTPLMMAVCGALDLLYAQARLAGAPLARVAAVIVPASLAGAVGVGGLAAGMRAGAGWRIPDFDLAEALIAPITLNFVLFLGWSLGAVWIATERARQAVLARAARAEAEALAAELGRLRLQLDPHFLFNALAGIATEIPAAPAAALAMVRALSAYLRWSLATLDRPVVPVAEEVAGIEAWLDVQRARFGDGLVASVSVAADAETRPIAGFLLQPLVENAVLHGRRRPVLALRVEISAAGDDLRVRIRNSGALTPKPGRQAGAVGGLGLANLARRLALHYPGRYRFSLREEGGEVSADLVLNGPPCSAS